MTWRNIQDPECIYQIILCVQAIILQGHAAGAKGAQEKRRLADTALRNNAAVDNLLIFPADILHKDVQCLGALFGLYTGISYPRKGRYSYILCHRR